LANSGFAVKTQRRGGTLEERNHKKKIQSFHIKKSSADAKKAALDFLYKSGKSPESLDIQRLLGKNICS